LNSLILNTRKNKRVIIGDVAYLKLLLIETDYSDFFEEYSRNKDSEGNLLSPITFEEKDFYIFNIEGKIKNGYYSTYNLKICSNLFGFVVMDNDKTYLNKNEIARNIIYHNCLIKNFTSNLVRVKLFRELNESFSTITVGNTFTFRFKKSYNLDYVRVIGEDNKLDSDEDDFFEDGRWYDGERSYDNDDSYSQQEEYYDEDEDEDEEISAPPF
jgi:hypothetical protein